MSTVESRTRKRFPRITSAAFEHPADTQALEAVKRIPILDKVFRKLMELGIERVFRIQLMGQAIHVTPKQCPKIYRLFKEAADILDMHEPDLFLTTNPQVNAFTFGVERPFIVLQSALVDLLDEEELMAVLGHELGHVKCGHVLYRSIAYFLGQIAGRILGLGGMASMGLAVALFEWSRKSELSADRAELLVVQDPDVCLRLHMKLAGGSKAVFSQTDPQEFLRQADTYEELDYSTLNKVYKLLHELSQSHPLPVYRAKEIQNWARSKQYQEILAGRYPTSEPTSGLRTCPHCQSKISPSFFFCPDCGKSART
ncbi:MAG: M48 family metallopeptidase [Candidatus Obscuribacterales bacterium]|nr:M48 family metallopeptidase [Candidatus Obscuribacterales bacterium]